MNDLFREVFQFFGRMGGLGLIGLGILDSSILFLPFGNDLLLVALTARQPDAFVRYALLATLGSFIGAVITDVLSRRIGEAGLSRIVDPNRVEKLRKRIEKKAWWVLGFAALLPPPFPFKVFLIAASGMQMSRWYVLGVATAGRLIRFFAVALLAARYGSQILRIAARPEVEYALIGLAVVSIVGSAISVYKWVQSARSGKPRTAYAQS